MRITLTTDKILFFLAGMVWLSNHKRNIFSDKSKVRHPKEEALSLEAKMKKISKGSPSNPCRQTDTQTKRKDNANFCD